MAEWVTGTVTQVTHWTETLFSIRLTAPIAPFTAGQFAKLALNLQGEKVQRAYSFVNAPNDPNLEFYLIQAPGGKLSPALSRLQPGDSIEVTQSAAGFFVLDEIPECQDLWMIATGTALGPYLSILQQGTGLARFRKIILVHAVRYAVDLSYLPMMQQLKQRYGNQLILQTVVSREANTGSLQGRIPQLISDGTLEYAVGQRISADASHVMLCGNPEMVRDTQRILKEQREMQKHLRRKPGHITSEHYW